MKNKAMRTVLKPLLGCLIAALGISTCLAEGPGVLGRATTTNVNITVQLYAQEDSTAVIQYTAVLYDGSTNAILDSVGSGATNSVMFSNVSITGVETPGAEVPRGYNLEQNYPNPFNPSTIIRFNIANTGMTTLKVYDILGRIVSTLVNRSLTPGSYQVTWSPSVASGVYFYRLQAGSFSATKKMIALDGSGHPAGATQVAVLGSVAGEVQGTVQMPLKKTQSGGYIIRLYATTGVTTPLVNNLTISIPSLGADTLITLYSQRPGAHVYLANTQQIIRGFGGANIVGWNPGLNYGDMTPAEMQTAFGNGDGQLGFSIMRLRIPPDSTQFSLNVPSTKLADSLGAKVIATPWTPPAWMKTNDNIIGGSLDTSNYAAFAAHLKAFGDTMASNGAPVYAVSVQNEPDFIPTTYEGCGWTGPQFLNFMRNNAAAVGYPVLMPESAGFNHSLSDPTLNDSGAASNVAFIGGHLYGTTPSNYPLALSKGKEVWMTEYLINSGSSTANSIDTGWAGAIQTAKSINDCMNANMSAYVWWYLVRYYGPIDDGKTGGVVGSITKKGYVMAQYSRYARPGFHRVAADATPQSNVYVTAYGNGASVVLVALNLASTPINQTFVIPHGGSTSYAAYVTSTAKNCALENVYDVSGITFTAPLDASSVTTFVSN